MSNGIAISGDLNTQIISKGSGVAATEVAKLVPLIAAALASVEATLIADMAAVKLTFQTPTLLTNQTTIQGWLAPLLTSMIEQQALGAAQSTLATAGLI
jgi:hypothetical protein